MRRIRFERVDRDFGHPGAGRVVVRRQWCCTVQLGECECLSGRIRATEWIEVRGRERDA
jgi:hypothetical protein